MSSVPPTPRRFPQKDSERTVPAIPAPEKPRWITRVLDSLIPRFLRKRNTPSEPTESATAPYPDRRQTSEEAPKFKRVHNRSGARRRPTKSNSPDHSSTAPSHPVIQKPDELPEIVELLKGFDRIALDTEADSLHCYFDKLCLLQLSVPGRNFLVDPLAGISLNPIFEAFSEKLIVIHSADYDLRLMRRLGYGGPTRLFDTMIAARLCGAMEFGLAALLHSHFGITLAKASQKANWALRPLPPQMLEYAVKDTAHLLDLADIQEARLRALGRWEWFEQSCEKALRSASVQREKDPDTLWRIAGYADLSPRGMSILRALWLWRDQEAQTVDRPAFHILNNDLLLEFSKRLDKGDSVEPRHLRGSRKDRFFAAIEEAFRLPESEWPAIIRKPRFRTTAQQETLFKELKKIRDDAAEHLQLDPTLIAPKATLEQLSRGESLALESLMPWQKNLLKLG